MSALHRPLDALIVGASGLVGGWLLRQAQAGGLAVAGTYLSQPQEGLLPLDIRRPAEVFELFDRCAPQVVYLPAALANVDFCEQNPTLCYEVNVLGVRHVVEAANRVGARVVFFSSDYIFDGEAGPYREEDTPQPVCQYGWQKLLGEHYVALHAMQPLIIRTTVVFGAEHAGKNFIYRLVRTLRAGRPLLAPVDQFGSPTYAPDLTLAVLQLAQLGLHGVYHVVGATCIDRYQFACEAASAFGLPEKLIRPVATAELGQTARRPLRAGMLAEKVLTHLPAPVRDYRAALRELAGQRLA